MALPISIPYTFASATTSIPLSNLDSDFATVVSTINGIGNGTVGLTTITSPAATALTIQSAGTTAVTIDTSQNVGIGTTSPENIANYPSVTAGGKTTSSGGLFTSQNSDGTSKVRFFTDGTIGSIGTVSNQSFMFFTNSAEKMRIDTSGNLLVGTTSPIGGQGKFAISAASGWAQAIQVGNTLTQGILTTNTSGTGTYNAMGFYNNGTTFSFCGGVTVSGSSTSFNTSSDYRLKENITPLTAGLSIIGALKPVNYDWINDKSSGEGFIAHELAEVIPLAVTGEKDAIDADGKPLYQGVDYSKIVVYLVAAIQELSAKNDALEARLAALEVK